MNARFAIETGAGRAGAVAVLRVSTDDPDAFFERSGVGPVPVGDSRVRAVFGVDHALVARPDTGTVLLMPHGGSAIVRAIAARLVGMGVVDVSAEHDANGGFTEGADAVERAMLRTVSSAASPMGIDLLLDQPRRWRAYTPGDRLADHRVLGRLIDPPVVVAAGGANIGKSSLLNAVAGASVALAFDRPGTTRDAVGVLVDLGGLVVRWVDTPGVLADGEASADPFATAAAAASRRALDGADLVLRCADASGPVAERPVGMESLLVATRCDRAAPGFAADAATSAVTGEGVAELAGLIRSTLVPQAAMADPAPWRFWGDGPPGA